MLAGVNLLGRKKDNPPADGCARRPEAAADSGSGCQGFRRQHRPEGQADAEAGCVQAPRPDRARTDDVRRGQTQAQGAARAQADPRGTPRGEGRASRCDGRSPRTDDGRRGRLPVAARQGPGAAVRPRHRRLAPHQRARPLHARRAGVDLHHACGSAGAVLHLTGDAGPDGDHGHRRFPLGPQGESARRREVPRQHRKRWKLGFYAASRASQLRRMRAPRPQVNRGDKVT